MRTIQLLVHLLRLSIDLDGQPHHRPVLQRRLQAFRSGRARNHNIIFKMEVGPLGYIVASIGYFREDARFAARQFRRAPAYAIFTTLVLALGIGTVTAMFTISYGVLMKPLPFRADRQLFDVVESTAKGDETFAAYPEITQLQQATANIADVAF